MLFHAVVLSALSFLIIVSHQFSPSWPNLLSCHGEQVTNLLARTVGTKESKGILNSTVSDSEHIYALPYAKEGAERGVLLVNKKSDDVAVTLNATTVRRCVEKKLCSFVLCLS
eukprot:COSAG06_NODE_2807_length_6256_cov_8.116778_3_plen_113_part_00